MSRLWSIALKTYLGLILVFLYLPIVVMIVMAFNQSPLYELPVVWDTIWFQHLASNDRLLDRQRHIRSLLALANTVVATMLGTMAAFAFARYQFRGKIAAAAPAVPAHHHPLAHHRHLHAGAVLLDRHRPRPAFPAARPCRALAALCDRRRGRAAARASARSTRRPPRPWAPRPGRPSGASPCR